MSQIFYKDKPIIIADNISDDKNIYNIKFKDFKLNSALKELSNKLDNIEQKADEFYEKVKKKKKDKRKKKKNN